MPLHLLSEHKALSLLDPVSHYVPEFGRNGKRDITIYQLLCHKAGIPTIPTDGWTSAELLLDRNEVLRLIYATAPDKPGRHHAYHALTAGFVVAALVEKVSGRSFRAFFREHISGPLGLAIDRLRRARRALKHVARNYATGFRFAAGGPVPEARHRHQPRARDRASERRALLPRGDPGGQRRRDSRRLLAVLPVPARRRPLGGASACSVR